MSLRIEINKLQLAHWTKEVGPSINDPIADQYDIVQNNDTLTMIMCSSKLYSGWLAKHVEPLFYQATKMWFKYTMFIDYATQARAQVAETDTKITDASGFTYDLSAQWNIANNWMFQIDNANWTWQDTGIRITPPQPFEHVHYEIEYLLDYKNHRSAIPAVIVNGVRHEVPSNLLWIPAHEVGWGKSEIVVQLQQCNNSTPGGYTLSFPNVGYVLTDDPLPVGRRSSPLIDCKQP